MNKIPVVFTFDSRILLGAGVSIKSLIDTANTDTILDIWVLHPDLSDKTISEFSKMVENTNHQINFIKIDKNDKRFSNLAVNSKSWTQVVYYKFLIPELLKDYDKAIYSDVDVCFVKDMSEVYNTDLENYEFGAVRAEKNSPNSKNHRYFPENKNEYTYWTGFMVMNLKKMREDNLTQKLFCVARDFATRLLFFDLDVLNITCNNIKPVDFSYVTLETIYEYEDITTTKEYEFLKEIYTKDELTNAKKSPAIIHYAGDLGKPWRRKNPPSYYQNYINSIPKSLRKLTLRDIRKKFFSKK